MKARMGLAMIVSLAAFAAAGTPSTTASTMGELMLDLLANIVLGLAAGAGARASLEAANAAGNLAGAGLGLGFASFFDPQSGSQTNSLGELMNALALGAAVALGVHREAIAWLVAGVMHAPDAMHFALRELLSQALVQMIGSAALGVRLAFPFLTVGVLAQLALGVASRFSPQIHLQNVGFALPLLVGGFVAYQVAAPAAEIAAKASIAALHAGG
jgi:flagellar biosynthetic protein FliR